MAMVTTSSEEAIHSGSELSGLLTAHHGPGRVHPTLDEPHLDAFVRREGEAEGVGRALGGPQPPRGAGQPVDEVEGADLVLGTPPAPVGDPSGQFGE